MYVHRLLSATADVNNTLVRGGYCQLMYITGRQANAAARYLKLYNKLTAPAAGTDTPVATFYLPPTAVNGGIFTFDFDNSPIHFPAGLGFALTTAVADNDTGALTAADVVGLNLIYRV